MEIAELKQKIAEHLAREEVKEAAELCQSAQKDIPEPDLLMIRGVIAMQIGDYPKALNFLKEAERLDSSRGDIAYNLGVALQKSGDLGGALQAWRRATALDPENLVAWGNLALAESVFSSSFEVCSVYQKALSVFPENKELLYNYANYLCRLGSLPEAERIYAKFVALYPDEGLGWINKGVLHKMQKRYDEAENCYRQAAKSNVAAVHDKAMFHLATLLLLQQRWNEGFKAYEARRKLPGALAAPWSLPTLSPSTPSGSRVLLWNDQGLGDGIMFLRFAPLLKERGYRLFAFVQDSLKPLVDASGLFENTYIPSSAPAEMDASLPLCSLPAFLDLLSPVDCGVCYAKGSEVSPYSFPPDGKKRIGLVWAGNPSHINDANRSLPLTALSPLFGLDGLSWYSLQHGAAQKELLSLGQATSIVDLSSYLLNMQATASLMKELDLVLSVDTAPAHLAGALGKKVWTLLPIQGLDWRWGDTGEESLWYPSMRLFRQTRSGEWKDVIEHIRSELAAWAS